MMNIDNIFGPGRLDMIYIYNYTQKTTFENKWDDVTMTCRGLILDLEHNIIARPFQKFFNLNTDSRPETMMDNLPTQDACIVTEKMDGSLGILWRYMDYIGVSTRGSFDSEQAKWATEFYKTHYSSFVWDYGITPLFEIIYPENRIVVDYKGENELTLLGIVRNVDGSEYVYEELKHTGFPDIVKAYKGMSPSDCVRESEMDVPLNAEGYVLRFDLNLPGAAYPLRVKIKLLDYVKLHRLIFNLNDRVLWELLKTGRDPKDILNELGRVPSDVFEWAKSRLNKLINLKMEIENLANTVFIIRPSGCSRKEIALFFRIFQPIQSICFAMLDNKSYEEIQEIMWDKVRPEKAELFRRISHEEI
jgi:hypothetical protein